MNNVKARKLLAILNNEEQSYARLNDKGLWWIGFSDYPKDILKFNNFEGGCSEQIILQYFLSEKTVAPDGISRNDKSFWVFHMKLNNDTKKMYVNDKKQITRDQAIEIINWYEKKRWYLVSDEGYNYNQFTAVGTLPVNFTFVKGDDGRDYRLISDGTLRCSNFEATSRAPKPGEFGYGLTDYILDDNIPDNQEQYTYLDWPVIKTRVDGKLYNLINGKLYKI